MGKELGTAEDWTPALVATSEESSGGLSVSRFVGPGVGAADELVVDRVVAGIGDGTIELAAFGLAVIAPGDAAGNVDGVASVVALVVVVTEVGAVLFVVPAATVENGDDAGAANVGADVVGAADVGALDV